MPQVARRPDDEARRALEALAAADPAAIDKALLQVREQYGSSADALRSLLVYRNAEEALARAMVELPVPIDPSTARAAQASENVWRHIASEYGLLSSSEASTLLGARNGNRTYASELRRRGELLAARRKNGYVFPGFQFDRRKGTLRSWVQPLLGGAEDADMSHADVIMWMMTPTTYFDGDRPVDHVDNAEVLLDVAERAWNVEW